jgi:uncharacterized protein YtpQ (UPF0354 family)
MSLFNSLFGKSKKADKTDPVSLVNRINLNKVYPRIKGIYDEQNPDPSPLIHDEITISVDEGPVIKPLAKGIGICYMLDKGDRYQIIQNKQLSEELTLEKLHEAALKNMAAAVADKTEMDGDPKNVMMLTNGGDFEATMLLADFLWGQIEPVFNDSVCVAIPTNDILFIAAKNNPEARESLRLAVRHYFENRETEGLIVRHIYERINGEWIYVETA